jgi:hypothetical protein
MVETGQEYDLKFQNAYSSLKNFLGLIPSAYASSLDNVKQLEILLLQVLLKAYIQIQRFQNSTLKSHPITLSLNIQIYPNR